MSTDLGGPSERLQSFSLPALCLLLNCRPGTRQLRAAYCFQRFQLWPRHLRFVGLPQGDSLGVLG